MFYEPESEKAKKVILCPLGDHYGANGLIVKMDRLRRSDGPTQMRACKKKTKKQKALTVDVHLGWARVLSDKRIDGARVQTAHARVHVIETNATRRQIEIADAGLELRMIIVDAQHVVPSRSNRLFVDFRYPLIDRNGVGAEKPFDHLLIIRKKTKKPKKRKKEKRKKEKMNKLFFEQVKMVEIKSGWKQADK